MAYFYFIIGVLMLTFGADRFVTGAQVIARRLGMSTLMIGIVLVGFVTSVPEMFVATAASLKGSPVMAIGNVIGSNIANIGLVLGVSGLIRPLIFPKTLLHHEFPILIIVSLFVYIMLIDGVLSRVDGFLLLSMFLILVAWMVLKVKKLLPSNVKQEMETAVAIPQLSFNKALIWWFLGLIILLVGAKVTVDSAIDIARLLGVSELVIGLTIVAVGTSLPELATAVVSVLKNEPELVIGNVIGSNLFNTLPVLMMPALISPTRIPHVVLTRDLTMMILITLLLGALSWTGNKHIKITKLKSAMLFTSLIGYLLLIYFTQ